MWKLFRQLKPFAWAVAAVLGLIFIQSMSELYLPTLMSDIVDKGITKGDTEVIYKYGGWMLLVALLSTACSLAASYLSSQTASGFGRNLRSRVFRRVEHFTLHEFDKVGTASLITRTTNDINQVQQVLIMSMRMLVMAPMMCFGGLILAYRKDSALFGVLAVALPVMALIIWAISRTAMPYFKGIQKKLDKLNLVLRENLVGIRVIRAFHREDQESRRFQEASWDLTELSVKVNKIMAGFMPAMMLIMNFTSIAILWFGSVRIDEGHMQVGDLMAFFQYVFQIMFSLLMMSFMLVMIPRAQASAVRINEVLDMEPEIRDTASPERPAADRRGYVEFRDVTFRYPGAEQPAVSGITFAAGPGEVTAIIGGTGSGKSTLVHLLERFYEAESGAILVDGTDIRQLTQADLRQKLGFVPQQAVLFTGTAADNIRFGRQDATDEEVRQAAMTAQAVDFIEEMPEGFQSMISQGGTNLSGGQKQRLSIARALVRRPEIYIFDDSFSALDYKTDARLRAALKRETADATVLLVAQRVSTVLDADRIIVLEDGAIVGIGTHKELMAGCEVYREIVVSQLSEEEIA